MSKARPWSHYAITLLVWGFLTISMESGHGGFPWHHQEQWPHKKSTGQSTKKQVYRLEDADYEGHSLAMLRRMRAAFDKRVEIVSSRPNGH